MTDSYLEVGTDGRMLLEKKTVLFKKKIEGSAVGTMDDMLERKLFGSMGCSYESSYRRMMGFSRKKGDG